MKKIKTYELFTSLRLSSLRLCSTRKAYIEISMRARNVFDYKLYRSTPERIAQSIYTKYWRGEL